MLDCDEDKERDSRNDHRTAWVCNAICARVWASVLVSLLLVYMLLVCLLELGQLGVGQGGDFLQANQRQKSEKPIRTPPLNDHHMIREAILPTPHIHSHEQ